jgi:hypothetical protein
MTVVPKNRPSGPVPFFLIIATAAALFFPHCRPSEKMTEEDYFASIKTGLSRFRVPEGRRLVFPLRLKNAGQKRWSSEASPPVFLSYHLLDGEGTLIRFDNPRTRLPGNINPGRQVSLNLRIRSPLEAGSYRLELDLLREGEGWFADGGSPTLDIEVEVIPNSWAGLDESDITSAGPAYFQTGDDELNTLYKLIRLTLDENLVSFGGRVGPVTGFSAGTDYPQIWLRDANTIIPASRLFFDRAALASWLEEHLRFQKEDGSLFDWLDSRGGRGKNTVETDQECSAVQAARQVCDILDPSWLDTDIGGTTLIERLSRALTWVWENRRDAGTGLITGAHTADWGDVDILDADEAATDVDGRTHWTVDIYDQAMFCAAAGDLARLLEWAGREEEAAGWATRRKAVRSKTNGLLWMEDRGYYRVHLHLDGLSHDFDEDDIFPMGGNAAALLSGLPDPGRAARIIETALARQTRYRVSTISGTPLPPYPRGTFRHPLMDHPFEYQNGGQWDWFGGRLILAMYREGFSRRATEKLKEIARKNIANGGFFEWEDRTGIGRGSDYYAGSAGVLAKAVVEGYFGLSLTRDSLSLCCRIGAGRGKIRISLPAAGCFAAYDYGFEPDTGLITLHINSDIPRRGEIRILSPWQDGGGGAKGPQDTLEVAVDGRPVRHHIDAVNEDAYIGFETDFQNRRITIRKK